MPSLSSLPSLVLWLAVLGLVVILAARVVGKVGNRAAAAL